MNTTLKKTVSAGILAVALAMQGTPAYAAISCTVAGNGSSSTSTCLFITSDTKTVNQTNTATVTNNAAVTATTGNNSASDNTGGSTRVDTGNATATVTQATSANNNAATLISPTGGQDHTMTIEGNGTGSTNTADIEKTEDMSVTQDNTANVTNNSTVTATTGNNVADDNTGGSVQVDTGNANVGSSVNVSSDVNHNTVQVGTSEGTGAVMVTISGNGSNSVNTTALITADNLTFDQSNDATIENDVDVTASTGNNSASDNTMGDVMVTTGNAVTDVSVDTSANSNAATVGLGVVGDVDLWMADNGTASDNLIDLELTVNESPTQDNTLTVDNTDLTFTGDTGNDVADGNTSGDTAVLTGDVTTDVNVTTDGNSNDYANVCNLVLCN